MSTDEMNGEFVVVNPPNSIQMEERHSFSWDYLEMSFEYSRYAKSIEDDGEWIGSDLPNNRIHRGFVVSAIVNSALFLEAYINELLLDAYDNESRFLIGKQPQEDGSINLDRKAISRMKRLVENGFTDKQSFSIIDRYDLVLLLSDKDAYIHGQEPYQTIQHIIKLRNLLVHYVPQWVDSTWAESVPGLDGKFVRTGMVKIEKQLSGKFKENRLVNSDRPFWPDKCLGYGCAEWATTKVFNFVEDFNNRLNISFAPYITQRFQFPDGFGKTIDDK